jgi:hypothetical protein
MYFQVQLSVDYTKNPQLKKLQFLAPGPKMTAVCESDDVKEGVDAPGINAGTNALLNFICPPPQW